MQATVLQRTLESPRDASTRESRYHPHCMWRRECLVGVGAAAVLTVALAGTLLHAQVRDAAGAAAPAPAPATSLPAELHARLIALERAQGVLFAALTAGNGKVQESAVLKRMAERVADVSGGDRPDAEADAGFRALGDTADALIRRAYAFRREVLGILAAAPPADRVAALEAAVQRYRRGGPALPDAPKDMAILYDHAYTSFIPPTVQGGEPERSLRYPTLTGMMWAARWYELALVEPLADAEDADTRARGLATVADRFARKLTGGTPLDGYPTELPLAPAIAPGLVALHAEAAAIIDNLSMLLDVITDVLVHPAVKDRRAAVSQAVTHFTTRDYRCVQNDEWIVVALRHSIFDQGGFALAPMSGYERNSRFGHGQHYGVKRAPPACDPE